MSNSEVPQSSEAGDGNSIKVFLRVRPQADLGSFDATCVKVESSKNVISMMSKPEPKVFTFDKVADVDTAQETVFSAVGKKITDGCLAGYNGTIFAYGQTGSGKTFTMLGPADNADNFQHELRGVIPRSFEYLFNLIKKEQELNGDRVQFLCRCSFLEIYKEQVFDLLDPASRGLQLRENIKRGVIVDGLIEESVSDAAEAYEVLTCGWLNRTVASTAMNRESSRSHAVFTVHIESKVNTGGVWKVRSSQLNLVDLAGSERQKDTHTAGLRLKEATSINKSLSTLGNVIMALGDITHGKTRHVPYRDSKLSFLLRDSLGGNAKTYIIACVHPGSKSFGETLSTLQFARRAKMIKNKAVVNEDMHGNVANLQAEIRKLRDMLNDYQTNGIPLAPSANGDTPTVSENDSPWKKFFIDAMFFREQIINDKQAIQEKLQRLEELCNRKEQSIRQHKMILKFREDALKKYEKAHKEKTDLGDEERMAIITALRGEVRSWEEAQKVNPELTQSKLEVDNLRSEIKRLRAQQTVADINRQRAIEMENTFKALMAEKEKDRLRAAVGAGSPVCTPPINTDTNISVATIERHKSQISKQQAEIENLKRDLLAERQESEKTTMDLSSELMSVKKAKEELEKTLKAQHVRSQIERETFEELHVETLKTMTTPKKARYNLTNRTVLLPASTKPGETEMVEVSLDGSFTSEDDIIQDIPPELSMEKVEALTEEIRKLQEENRIFHAQMDNHDTELIQQVEERSRLECQKNLMEELYKRESTAWTAERQQLNDKVLALNNSLKAVQGEKDVSFGEVQDLRIMYEASEKRIKQSRVEMEKYRAAQEKEIANLETTKMQLEVELVKFQKQVQVLHEEQTALQESEENLQATQDFTQERLSQAEQSLIEANAANQHLQDQVTCARSALEIELEKNQQLCSQLQKQGDKEEKLVETLREIEKLRKELSMAENLAEDSVKRVHDLEVDLLDKNSTIDRLNTADQEKNTMIGTISTSIREQREQILEKERCLEQLLTQVEELQQANEDLVRENDCLRLQARTDAHKYKEEFTGLTNDLQKQQGQYEVLQEDLDDMMEKNGSLEADLAQSLQRSHDLATQLEMTNEQILALKSEKDALSVTVSDMKKSLGCATPERPDSGEKDSQPHDNLRISFLKYRQSFELLSDQKNTLTAENDELKKEVCDVKARMLELYKECKSHKDTIDKLNQQMDIEYNVMRDTEMDLRQQLYDIQKNSDLSEEMVHAAHLAKDEAEKAAQSSRDENTHLKDALDTVAAEGVEQQIEMERLRDILRTKQEEFDTCHLGMEAIVTEKVNIEKAYNELMEKFTVVDNEVAILSGHQNNKQKIKYVAKIHEERQEALQKYNGLFSDYTKLKIKCDKLEADCRRGTPMKRVGHPSGYLTPTRQESNRHHRPITPSHLPKDVSTPIKDKSFVIDTARTPQHLEVTKENVEPDV